MSKATAFLKSVLGDDGAEALRKANARVPTLGAVLTPRTIISWLSTAVRLNYEGEIPGVSNSYMALQKSESGFTGALTIGDDVHPFANSDLLHVAAAIGVALGIEDTHVDPLVKSTDVSKIGKSIDLLVKARVVAKAMLEESSESSKEEVEKIEKPGLAAAPKAPEQPEKQITPQAVAPSTNKTTKPPMAKAAKELVVKKSESSRDCPECGLKQFRGDKFIGCMCWRYLASDVKVVKSESCYTLRLGSRWDEDAFLALASGLRRGD